MALPSGRWMASESERKVKYVTKNNPQAAICKKVPEMLQKNSIELSRTSSITFIVLSNFTNIEGVNAGIHIGDAKKMDMVSE